MNIVSNVKNYVCGLRQLVKFRSKKIFISKGTFLHPKVVIGKCTRINATSHIDQCTIGAFCAIGGRLVVRSSNHYHNFLNMQDWAQQFVLKSNIKVGGKSEGSVEIGNAVWIGDSVIILPDVEIGDGAVIGAGSVVTKSIPPFSIAVGNPAQVIKMRFSKEIIEIICQIRWWEWDLKTIQKRRELFEIDLNNSSPNDLLKIIDKYKMINKT